MLAKSKQCAIWVERFLGEKSGFRCIYSKSFNTIMLLLDQCLIFSNAFNVSDDLQLHWKISESLKEMD
ncbi:hypothetical protein L1887_30054 [Cichorium endivia]|nr:hypothetical protein L1887_30054 [Cichorium endivia]